MRRRIGVALAIAVQMTAASAMAMTVAADDGLRVVLKPVATDGRLGEVGVTLTLERPNAGAGDVLLDMPLVRAMAPSALQDATALVATDDVGALALVVEVDEPDASGFLQGRRWRAGRQTQGDVVVRYAATPRPITSQTRPGPLYDMRAEADGFHSSGGSMIALPPEGWPRPVELVWDLSAMPAGARGASSLGEGDQTATVPQAAMGNGFFMAGSLSSLPADGHGSFVGYWITPPAFDLEAPLVRIEAAYEDFSKFFGDEAAPFRVFMRTTERFAGGGSGGYQSFMFGTVEGQVRNEAELLGLLSHETLHNWLNGLGDEPSQWWSEGTTSYYTEVLSYRTGLITLAQFQDGMNDLVRSYTLNPRSGLSNAEVTQNFFSDGDAQLVPYQRGPLYFAHLDARVRAHSGGTRRVDDLVLELLDARRTDGDYSAAGWSAILGRELGEDGVANFEAMMAGVPLDLPADMLGACFERQTVVMRRFVPGFRVEHDGRVMRIQPDGRGHVAGIRDGDRLVDPQALKALEQAGTDEAMLEVLRDGQVIHVRLTPWDAAKPGYEWSRNALPEALCNI